MSVSSILREFQCQIDFRSSIWETICVKCGELIKYRVLIKQLL
nr:MAG TPA: hypothetical protein [Caudoviricetes sp.]